MVHGESSLCKLALRLDYGSILVENMYLEAFGEEVVKSTDKYCILLLYLIII